MEEKDLKTIRDFADWVMKNREVDAYIGNKIHFSKVGKSVLKIIAKYLELDVYDIRYNKGGPAVSGDCVLHGNNIYVLFNADHICDWILFRTCDSITDYTGHMNHQIYWTDLKNDPEHELKRIKLLLWKYVYNNSIMEEI